LKFDRSTKSDDPATARGEVDVWPAVCAVIRKMRLNHQ
jgi:hypothetical protein